MAILFTGKGGSGSWQIRGEQLGAIGHRAPHCTDPKGFEVAVVVKRTPPEVIAQLRAHGVPWVWDVLDVYPQPAANRWTREQAISWVRDRIRIHRPDGIVWPNRKMMEDCDVDLPQTVLYHHHRPGIAPNPIRARIETVGYEGGAYLGRWETHLRAECERRGWRFVVNPGELANVDVVVAFRDPVGYVPFSWKSNVKLANAHGSGTPFVGAPECGYMETMSGAEYWATDMHGVRIAFDWLTDPSAREQVSERFRAAAYPIEQAQRDLSEFLCRFK